MCHAPSLLRTGSWTEFLKQMTKIINGSRSCPQQVIILLFFSLVLIPELCHIGALSLSDSEGVCVCYRQLHSLFVCLCFPAECLYQNRGLSVAKESAAKLGSMADISSTGTG